MKMDIKQLKRENQDIRELVNQLEKSRNEDKLPISEYDDYYSFLKGFDYVLDRIKWTLNK